MHEEVARHNVKKCKHASYILLINTQFKHPHLYFEWTIVSFLFHAAKCYTYVDVNRCRYLDVWSFFTVNALSSPCIFANMKTMQHRNIYLVLSKCSNRFLLKKRTYIKLTSTPVTPSAVTKFGVIRNGTFSGTRSVFPFSKHTL